MTKYFCDCCGRETTSLYKFEYYIHIDDVLNGKLGYIDNEYNPVSGRTTRNELCAKCYNEIVIEAVKKMVEMKSKEMKDEDTTDIRD